MAVSGENEIYIAVTEDGSISLASGEHGELYHNRIGAYTEALHNYSKVAFQVLSIAYKNELPKCLNVLDCCFGLGYNSFVMAQELPEGVSIDVTAIELDPAVLTFVPQILDQACFSPLRNLGLDQLKAIELSQFKETFISCPGKNNSLRFDLVNSCLRQYLRRDNASTSERFDLVLHDPFSPRKMTELWTIDLFAAYRDRLKSTGIILTYSSAPAVRGALLELGFYVYRTPVLGGKWGGTLAVKGDYLEQYVDKGAFGEDITHLGLVELERLAKSSRVPYRDPDLKRSREEILQARMEEQKSFGR